VSVRWINNLGYFYTENVIFFFTKQTTPMRRSTVLILPLQLVFPGQTLWLILILIILLFFYGIRYNINGTDPSLQLVFHEQTLTYFNTVNIFFLFTKQATLMREQLLVSVPW
jgi:hypothetical protein